LARKPSTDLFAAVRERDLGALRKGLAEARAAGRDAVTRSDAYGNLLLPLAASARGSREIVELLLAEGIDVDVMGRDGDTALWHAVEDGLPEIVQVLLEHGADPNLRPAGKGWAPPIVMARDPGIVRLLLEHGADPNLEGPEGVRAVHLAAHARQGQILELLLARGADPAAGTTDVHFLDEDAWIEPGATARSIWPEFFAAAPAPRKPAAAKRSGSSRKATAQPLAASDPPAAQRAPRTTAAKHG
jgi:ankyrin repeat protein